MKGNKAAQLVCLTLLERLFFGRFDFEDIVAAMRHFRASVIATGVMAKADVEAVEAEADRLHAEFVASQKGEMQ